MTTTRRGEQDKVWFRTERCFSIGSDWYASTREGVNLGPFKSRQEAASAAERYIRSLLTGREKQAAGGDTNRVARHGIWASNNYV